MVSFLVVGLSKGGGVMPDRWITLVSMLSTVATKARSTVGVFIWVGPVFPRSLGCE